MGETQRDGGPLYHHHLLIVYTDCQACIHERALAAARDEVIEAAKAWVTNPTHANEVAVCDAVAALAKLEGK